MYILDIILIFKRTYGDKYEKNISCVEEATDHYIPRHKPGSTPVGNSLAMIRLDKIPCKKSDINIRISLHEIFSKWDLTMEHIEVGGPLVKWWELHTKSITICLGLFGSFGAIITGISEFTNLLPLP